MPSTNIHQYSPSCVSTCLHNSSKCIMLAVLSRLQLVWLPQCFTDTPSCASHNQTCIPCSSNSASSARISPSSNTRGSGTLSVASEVLTCASRVQARGSELWTLRLFCNLTTTASWACIDHLAACGLGRTRSPATSSSSRVMNSRWHHYLTLSILISARTVQVREFMITTGVTVDRPTPGLHVWVDDTRRCA